MASLHNGYKKSDHYTAKQMVLSHTEGGLCFIKYVYQMYLYILEKYICSTGIVQIVTLIKYSREFGAKGEFVLE